MMLATFNIDGVKGYSEYVVPSGRTHVFTKNLGESRSMLKQLQEEGYTVSVPAAEAFKEVDGELQRVAFHTTEGFAAWKFGGLAVECVQFTDGSLNNITAKGLLFLLSRLRK